jgi:CDP-diacylglycerol--serine O-phosphatidyltransferase
METNILKMITVADLASLANAICGFLAIIMIISQNMQLSAVFLLLAVIFDSIDGTLARIFNQGDIDHIIFGETIDSLSDVISFGLAPAVIIFMLSGYYYMLIPSILLLACGVLRLTRYNTIAAYQDQPTETFIGLPIPVSSFILAAFMLSSYNVIILAILMVIISILMVSDIEYPKIRELPLILITLVLMILSMIPQVNNMLYHIPAYLLLLLGLLYIFGIIIISVYDGPGIIDIIKDKTESSNDSTVNDRNLNRR